jgi:plastocyanin domain-containing protein
MTLCHLASSKNRLQLAVNKSIHPKIKNNMLVSFGTGIGLIGLK